MTGKIFQLRLKKILRDSFSLKDDMEQYEEVVEHIKKGVDIKGTNLWVLIFAIFVASIGLNVNSTAVIIGAMLISPLMGPIMGIGMGVGINDFELIKRGIRNLAIATTMSVITSTLYFLISPLHQAQSELLARTTPTIWDVFIALFGGLAGIVAATRKEKSNVIPGVAIATALMPPLCTAGYGIATGQWIYFLGAFYLFFINSVFISLSSLLIVRFLNFPRISLEDDKKQKRVRISIAILVVLAIVPSIYLGYRIVKRSLFENNVAAFIHDEFQFEKTQVLKYDIDEKSYLVEVFVVGKQLPEEEIELIKTKFKKQFNQKKSEIKIHQGLSGVEKLDISSIKTGVIEDLYKKSEEELKTKDQQILFLENQVFNLKKKELNVSKMTKEIRSFYPNIQKFSVSYMPVVSNDSLNLSDTILTAVIQHKGSVKETDRLKVFDWLKTTTDSDTLRLFIE